MFNRTPSALALALLGTLTLAPITAAANQPQVAASAQLAGDAPKRLKEGPLKTGGYGEVAWRPALGLFSDGVVPQMRLSVALGGRLSSRFKLALHPHVDVLLDRPDASGVGVNLLGTVYTWRHLFVRWGFGVVSAVPNARNDRASRPAYGGLVGLGYDWKLKKKIHMGLGADVDVRWLKDGTARTTLISGVHFWFG